ncbi:MAG: phosphonate metabolism protein/1,5-bisphosphokinase (PRPP-forming) PhnN [Pseudomonadota bacterium]
MRGVLLLVVGPSGVGKDTLMDGARKALGEDPDFVFARRTITRKEHAGGEDHEGLSEADFRAAEADGAFFITWQAHGHRYGIRTGYADQLAKGRNVVINVSRRVVVDLAARFTPTTVLSVDAPAAVIRQRLHARGREDAADVTDRIARDACLPQDKGLTIVPIRNDGAIEAGVARFTAALIGAASLPLRLARAPVTLWAEPLCLIHKDAKAVAAGRLNDTAMVEVVAGQSSARARLALVDGARVIDPHTLALSQAAFDALGVPEGTLVTVRRSPSPKSRDVLRKKVAGEALSATEIDRVVRDLVEGRYSPAEIAGFLVAAATHLTLAEVTALTRARAALFERFSWDRPLVVDKHSMGGVPGSRITMILVPIIAAHGMIIPKTSSRAITSAAGTADVMECVAQVELPPASLRKVVTETNGAIAWSGRISHSPLDDTMNAINRPLGIRSSALDVSSILSKKLAAGASHVVVDIPVGRYAKTKTEAEGQALAKLFRDVGQGVGLTVEAILTDGSRPIGRGVGPALELDDVRAVLSRSQAAPADLTHKALTFATRLIALDPDVGPKNAAARANDLLASGAAQEAFQRIITAQGARTPVTPGPFLTTVGTQKAGRIAAINGFAIAGLARRAGAPADKGAGVRLLAGIGESVRAGEPLLTVHAGARSGLDEAGSIDTDTLVTIH